jgi:hypothetical protein
LERICRAEFKELNKRAVPSFVPRKINKGGYFAGLQQRCILCNMAISGDYLRCKTVGKKLKSDSVRGQNRGADIPKNEA